MDDASVGRSIRALRNRRGWRQSDLAGVVGLSQSLVSRAERGHVESLSIRSVRAMFAALDAGCTLTPWWRSGQLERLLDEEHAALTARAVGLLRAAGWQVEVEATFSVYGEKGSIDVLALRPAERTALMVEVKSTITSTEELHRSADKKARLLPRIVAERHGWRPVVVARVLVIADTTTNRRRVARATVFDTTFPIRGDAAGALLRDGRAGTAGGALLFLSPRTAGTRNRPITARQRVRPGRSCTTGATDGTPRSQQGG